MNITRRPRLRYPNTCLLTIALILSLKAMLSLAALSSSELSASILDLLPICDQCSAKQLPNPNSTLN